MSIYFDRKPAGLQINPLKNKYYLTVNTKNKTKEIKKISNLLADFEL